MIGYKINAWGSSMNIDLALIDAIILQLPNYVFVKDKDLIYRLCNLNFAKSVGVSHPQEIIGKTDYDMPWGKYTADNYLEEDMKSFKGTPIYASP